MWTIEVKDKTGKWIKSPLPVMDTEMDAYRLALERYGDAMWCSAIDGGDEAVRIIRAA